MSTYPTPPASFDALIAPFPDATRETALALRDLVRHCGSNVDETVSGGLAFANALYSVARATNVFAAISPAASHCKLYLHRVQASDVSGLKLEGAGRHSRHIKVASAADARQPAVAKAIALAFDRAARP
jgi:hypothetical protein